MWSAAGTHCVVILAQSVRSSWDYESFQLAVLIVCVRVEVRAECVKIEYSMRMRIAQAKVMPNVGGFWTKGAQVVI